jgi:hypothetical protein
VIEATIQAMLSLLHTDPTLNASLESPTSSEPGLGFVLAPLLGFAATFG